MKAIAGKNLLSLAGGGDNYCCLRQSWKLIVEDYVALDKRCHRMKVVKLSYCCLRRGRMYSARQNLSLDRSGESNWFFRRGRIIAPGNSVTRQKRRKQLVPPSGTNYSAGQTLSLDGSGESYRCLRRGRLYSAGQKLLSLNRSSEIYCCLNHSRSALGGKNKQTAPITDREQ